VKALLTPGGDSEVIVYTLPSASVVDDEEKE